MNEEENKTGSSNYTGRKRSRSMTDECEECIPIAKKINNLQIRSRDGSSEDQVHNNGALPPHWDCQNDISKDLLKDNCSITNGSGFNNNSDMFQGQSSSQHYHTSCDSQPGPSHEPLADGAEPSHQLRKRDLLQTMDQNDVDMEPYEPELDHSSNPHYYGINELLYYANIVRQNRSRNGFSQ